jgi:hypothetical protein
MIYLVAAYVSAAIILGGFLWLSLSHLRELSSKAPAKK